MLTNTPGERDVCDLSLSLWSQDELKFTISPPLRISGPGDSTSESQGKPFKNKN